MSTSPDNRIVVDATPEYLTCFFHNHIYIQAQKLAAPYIGKWIKITGPLSNVGELSGDSFQVTFADRGLRTSQAQVYMYFKREWVDRLSVLKQDDRITILGKISGISGVQVDLENCELIT